jgi:fused signal recognition particle receptor
MDEVRTAAKKRTIKSTQEVLPFLKSKVTELLKDDGQRLRIATKPTIVLVVGVNGVGKTTTIGKLANYYHLFNYKVMLAAGRYF